MGTLHRGHAERDRPALRLAAGLALALALALAWAWGAAAQPTPPAWPGEAPAPEHRILGFDDLDGWAADDHAAALTAFLRTCPDLDGPHWPAVCALAGGVEPGAARLFFEAAFRPVLTTDGARPLLTGYYEPELRGSRRRTARHRHPLYARPEAPKGGRWPTRAEIDAGALAGRGLEIAWVADPVEAMFLQVQGSGRVRLEGGGTIRLGYGGSNGHPYRSVGREMIRRGWVEPDEASAAVISARVAADPAAGRRLLQHNANYVFFRVIEDLPADAGPLGAMRRPLTALRSAAVDPAHVPLGAPVWIEREGAAPMRRLMVAQDVGSRVKGAQRADLFFGTGAEAGARAGRVRDRGRVVALLPAALAHAAAPDPLGERLPPADTPPETAPEALLAAAEPQGRAAVSRRAPMTLALAPPAAASAATVVVEPPAAPRAVAAAPRPPAAAARLRPRPRPADGPPAGLGVRPRPRPSPSLSPTPPAGPRPGAVEAVLTQVLARPGAPRGPSPRP